MNYTEEQIRNMGVGEKLDLAKNPNTSIDVLEVLSRDKTWTIRRRAALNPNTPVDVLKDLATDKEERVREEVAWNHNTPSEVLEILSTDEEWHVRWGVTKNPNSTDQILVSVFDTERSMKYPDKDVLEAIIANANCPGYLKAVIQTIG
jgi:hypothetical protein